MKIDYDAIAEQLPENGVPDAFVAAATHLPEMDALKLTMEGPASRRSLFAPDVDDDGALAEDIKKVVAEQNAVISMLCGGYKDYM